MHTHRTDTPSLATENTCMSSSSAASKFLPAARADPTGIKPRSLPDTATEGSRKAKKCPASPHAASSVTGCQSVQVTASYLLCPAALICRRSWLPPHPPRISMCSDCIRRGRNPKVWAPTAFALPSLETKPLAHPNRAHLFPHWHSLLLQQRFLNAASQSCYILASSTRTLQYDFPEGTTKYYLRKARSDPLTVLHSGYLGCFHQCMAAWRWRAVVGQPAAEHTFSSFHNYSWCLAIFPQHRCYKVLYHQQALKHRSSWGGNS